MPVHVPEVQTHIRGELAFEAERHLGRLGLHEIGVDTAVGRTGDADEIRIAVQIEIDLAGV
jgi:hypothetical protein